MLMKVSQLAALFAFQVLNFKESRPSTHRAGRLHDEARAAAHKLWQALLAHPAKRKEMHSVHLTAQCFGVQSLAGTARSPCNNLF